jgi:haloalkane dehalogenase
MIPGLIDSGCRVVVPDLVGFGRSDKPSMRDDYTYGRHLRWLSQTISEINAASELGSITLFCQDWGGLLGLCHVAQHPEMYRGVTASNTGVPLGRDIGMTDENPFAVWRQFSQDMDPFVASACVASEVSPLPSIPGFQLSEEEKRAYDAPFVDETYVAGPRQFPLLVPTSGVHPGAHLCREIWSLLADFQRARSRRSTTRHCRKRRPLHPRTSTPPVRRHHFGTTGSHRITTVFG